MISDIRWLTPGSSPAKQILGTGFRIGGWYFVPESRFQHRPGGRIRTAAHNIGRPVGEAGRERERERLGGCRKQLPTGAAMDCLPLVHTTHAILETDHLAVSIVGWAMDLW